MSKHVDSGGPLRSKPARHRSPQQQGFSLIELMTVVAIVGVLSALAIPTFSDYIYKSRTSEATEFLGVIRLREESYRAEFGLYCSTMNGATPDAITSLDDHNNLLPDPDTNPRDPKVFTQTAPWRALGARPSGPVRFGYGVVAGAPATAVATGRGWTDATADFWFIARAVGDLDADGTFGTFEIYSASKNVWIGNSDDTPLDKGWE